MPLIRCHDRADGGYRSLHQTKSAGESRRVLSKVLKAIGREVVRAHHELQADRRWDAAIENKTEPRASVLFGWDEV